SPMKTTFTITLPLVAPAIISGALLVFIQSLEIFAIPAAIGVPGGIYVVVTEIYQAIQDLPPSYSEAAALSVPLLIVCGVALWLQNFAVGRGKSFSTVGGKAYRSKLVQLGPWRWVALGAATLYF